ncbi:MAG: MFS transporter [Myxococcaceae bacterium]|nr:MFS transporter [Myxococcaceae bacterium]
MWLSALALFAVSLGYGVVVPLVPSLTGGAGGLGLSLVYSLYSAAKIGTQVPGGVWVDRVGARRIMVVGLSLYCVSTLALLVPGPVWWLVGVRVVEGVATGLVFPAVFARVFAVRGPGQGTSLGIVGGVGSSGLVVGPVLAGLLGPRDVRLPVAVAAAIALLTLVLVVLERGAPAAPAQVRTLSDELGQLLRLARQGAFVGVMLPIGFNKLSYTALQGVLPLHAQAHVGLALPQVTLLFAAMGVTFALAQPLGGFLADRFPVRPLVSLCAPLSMASLAAMSFAPGPWSYAAALVGYILGSSLVFAVVMKHAADTFGGDALGGLYGVLGTLTDTMTVLGPLLFVTLYASAPELTHLAMALTGVLFVAGFLLL